MSEFAAAVFRKYEYRVCPPIVLGGIKEIKTWLFDRKPSPTQPEYIVYVTSLNRTMSVSEFMLHDISPVREPSERVNHPRHYNTYKGLEIIDLVEQMNFNRGNVVKYIARAGVKSPETDLEDLKKAKWYLDREIERISSKDDEEVREKAKYKCFTCEKGIKICGDCGHDTGEEVKSVEKDSPICGKTIDHGIPHSLTDHTHTCLFTKHILVEGEVQHKCVTCGMRWNKTPGGGVMLIEHNQARGIFDGNGRKKD